MLVDYKDILYQWIAYTKHNLLQYLIHDKPRPQTTNEFPKHERKPQPRRAFLPQTKYDKQNPQKATRRQKHKINISQTSIQETGCKGRFGI